MRGGGRSAACGECGADIKLGRQEVVGDLVVMVGGRWTPWWW